MRARTSVAEMADAIVNDYTWLKENGYCSRLNGWRNRCIRVEQILFCSNVGRTWNDIGWWWRGMRKEAMFQQRRGRGEWKSCRQVSKPCDQHFWLLFIYFGVNGAVKPSSRLFRRNSEVEPSQPSPGRSTGTTDGSRAHSFSGLIDSASDSFIYYWKIL